MSTWATELRDIIVDLINTQGSRNLKFPLEIAQRPYYQGNLPLSREDIDRVSEALEGKSIYQENTRIREVLENSRRIFRILQALVETDFNHPEILTSTGTVRIARGDHKYELEQTCSHVEEGLKFVETTFQRNAIWQYLKSFRIGSIEAFKSSQRSWVRDINTSIETNLGFAEPNRDRFGSKAEFLGLTAIKDAK
ncbi:bifunctional diacylglycerol diphosphate phosphatase/phosphatidate phosphatase [Schaereria dolodes]|nr:bifunctional diacylglycerol diphosphate phosphatase/phosphatidate phosphatase [Schaereria dolodes]